MKRKNVVQTFTLLIVLSAFPLLEVTRRFNNNETLNNMGASRR